MTTLNSCPRCGAPLAAGARFCSRCGYDASGEQAVATEKMPGISIPVPAAPTTAAEVEVDPQAGLIDDLRRATLGDYDIAKELGRGGMATVFLAHEIALDRKVAIKVMSPALLSAGKGMADRFKREARTAAKLSHPHIIPIYGVRESGKLLFFVMKYVEGRALDAIIKETGPLPIKMVLAVLAQAGGALDYAHHNGVVHRDIKPANIMVDTDGWTIVTDFGIAKVRESQGLTMTGATIGTPTYMSPEQCSAKEITGATDQYSLGIAAYEMLTGKVPFDADSVMSLMWQHFHEPPPPLLERRPDCPPVLAQAVERMLAKRAADRWPSLEEAIEAIGTPAANDPIRQQMKKLARGSAAPLGTSPHTPLSPVPKFTTPPPTAGAPVKSSTPISAPSAATSAPTTPIPATNEPPAPHLPSTPLEPISSTVASHDITDSPTAILASTPVPPTAPPAPPKARITTPTSLPPLPRGITPPPPPSRKRPSVKTAMPPATVAPVAEPKQGNPLKWIGLAAALVVIGVGGWAIFGRGKGNTPAPAPGTPAAPPAPVASITVIPSSTALVVGDTAQLAAVLMDASRNILASVGHTVVWRSGDTTKARMSPSGVVQARAAGRVDVIAMSEGRSDTGAVVITTVAAPVAGVEILGPSGVATGDTTLLTAHPKDAQGNVLTGRTITWGSSDRTIATVSPTGTVTALRLGAVTITALVEKKAGSTRLTITPVAIASVTITPSEAALQIGAKAQLVATAHDAHDRTLTGRPVRWSSSANAIATVAPNGVVTGVAPGQTTITAQIESQTARAAVSVALLPVATVTLTPTTLTLAVGRSSQITVTLRDARGATLRDRDVTWTTSDPSIVGVSPTGLVNASRGGSATITATSENAKATVTITVPAPAAPPAVANNPAPESQPPAVVPPQPPANNPPAEAARVVARHGVTAGGQHTCALTTTGAVACWGSNDFGQLADAAAGTAANVPTLISGVSGATLLTAGNNHTCALADGAAICWGGNLKGQLGNGRNGGAAAPAPVIGGHTFQSIVAGSRHTCGLGSDGVAWCWGDNDNGQLGNGTNHGNATPQRVSGTTKFKMLAAGSDHSCGLGTDGRVYCWGDGFSGQLGRGTREATNEPNPVDGDVKFSSLTAGGKHACAIAVTGKAYCWGANVAGEIGDGSKSERDSPVPVAGTRSFTALTAGFEHTCGLTADGDAYCWGRNREGQIGDGTRIDKQAPVKVAFGPSLQSVGAGGNHTCAVTSSGVVCWGGNIKGQLGDASVTARLTPVSVESGH
jgi:serine/threonine protein kinase/alpha-tubulin suppressor-like RCC1 family protein/uncharacterized protein YjdB